MNMAVRRDGRGKLTVMEGQSLAMLKLWAMNNTWGKANTFVCDETNKVVFLVQGRGRDLPKITDKFEEDIYVELEA